MAPLSWSGERGGISPSSREEATSLGVPTMNRAERDKLQCTHFIARPSPRFSAASPAPREEALIPTHRTLWTPLPVRSLLPAEKQSRETRYLSRVRPRSVGAKNMASSSGCAITSRALLPDPTCPGSPLTPRVRPEQLQAQAQSNHSPRPAKGASSSAAGSAMATPAAGREPPETRLREKRVPAVRGAAGQPACAERPSLQGPGRCQFPRPRPAREVTSG